MEHFLQQFENFGHAKQEPQPVTARDSLKSPKEAQQGPKMFHFSTGDHKLQSQAKKSRNENEFKMKAGKKADFQMNFKNEKNINKTKKTSFKLL